MFGIWGPKFIAKITAGQELCKDVTPILIHPLRFGRCGIGFRVKDVGFQVFLV